MEGNQQKMREALVALRDRFNNNVMAYQDRYFKFSGWHWHKKAAEAARWRDVFQELKEVCDAALALPPRQCDVRTPEDQAVRFGRLCGKYYDEEGPCNEECPLASLPIIHGFPRCQAYWAQTPCEAKEGGAE